MDGFYDGGGGRGRAIGLAQDFPVHDDKIVRVCSRKDLRWC